MFAGICSAKLVVFVLCKCEIVSVSWCYQPRNVGGGRPFLIPVADKANGNVNGSDVTGHGFDGYVHIKCVNRCFI